MAGALDPDGPRADSLANMAAHLTGPFGGGAREEVVPLDASARAAVLRASREPLLLATILAPLETGGLRLRAVLDPDGTATPLPTLDFAPYTEAGASLPLHRPSVDAATRTAAPFSVALTLATVDPDGSEAPVLATEVAAVVELRLVEGVLGGLLYVLGAEKQRIRRQGREVAAQRLLDRAHDNALDRLGAELGVPRLADDLVVRDGAIETSTRREPDEEYRNRLALYRPFLQPSRSHLLTLLNGPGSDGDANQGLLGRLGLSARFRLSEADNEFAVTLHLVASDGPATRDAFLAWVRAAILLWPQNTPQGNMAHAARFLPTATRDQVAATRAELRGQFAFAGDAASNPALAPLLADALLRVGRCRAALGETTQLTMLRAQASDHGSRYELGLGVDVAALAGAELDRLAAALVDPQRTPAADPQTEALLAAAAPLPAAEDPDGRWLFEACGLRTVHRIDAGTLYLSHLPTSGLVVTGPDGGDPGTSTPSGTPLPLEARFHAAGDPGGNAVLLAGIAGAASAWATRGGPAFEVLDSAAAVAAWNTAVALAPDGPAAGAFGAAGLPALADPTVAVAALQQLPLELLVTLRLDATQAADILAGAVGAAAELLAFTDILRAQGLTSALPLVTATGEVLLVVGVLALPGAGLNLSERRATGFRWYVVPIQGAGGTVRTVGSRSVFTPSGPGLSAIVVLGYARLGLTDPYEYRVELPDGALLDLHQYEFLMNLLDRSFPAGVQVNTFGIRRRHVDLDGDGTANPLPSVASRTFRRFRRQRHRGETSVTLD